MVDIVDRLSDTLFGAEPETPLVLDGYVLSRLIGDVYIPPGVTQYEFSFKREPAVVKDVHREIIPCLLHDYGSLDLPPEVTAAITALITIDLAINLDIESEETAKEDMRVTLFSIPLQGLYVHIWSSDTYQNLFNIIPIELKAVS